MDLQYDTMQSCVNQTEFKEQTEIDCFAVRLSDLVTLLTDSLHTLSIHFFADLCTVELNFTLGAIRYDPNRVPTTETQGIALLSMKLCGHF